MNESTPTLDEDMLSEGSRNANRRGRSDSWFHGPQRLLILEPREQIAWSTMRLKQLDILGVTAQILIEFIRLIEKLSGRGNAATVLQRKYALIWPD